MLVDDSVIWTQFYRNADTKGGLKAVGSEEQWNSWSCMAEAMNITTMLYYKQIIMTLSDFYSYINKSHIIYRVYTHVVEVSAL